MDYLSERDNNDNNEIFWQDLLSVVENTHIFCFDSVVHHLNGVVKK